MKHSIAASKVMLKRAYEPAERADGTLYRIEPLPP